jgi:secondary thiamine-phosphate synthase enzyme
MLKSFQLNTSSQNELIDITAEIKKITREAGVRSGICHIFIPHTTAGVTINEAADPSVKRDILMALDHIVPDDLGYQHAEGNSPAHVKATLTGSHQEVFIHDGKLQLGTWQGIYFAEFDGPRERTVSVKIVTS